MINTVFPTLSSEYSRCIDILYIYLVTYLQLLISSCKTKLNYIDLLVNQIYVVPFISIHDKKSQLQTPNSS